MKFSSGLYCVDLECTGADPVKADICQIGVAVTDKRLNIIKTFESLVKPLTDYRESEAMAVHKITEEQLKSAPDLNEVLAQVERLVPNPRAYTLAAWGPIFDIVHLRAGYSKVTRPCPFSYRSFDIKSAVTWELAKNGEGSFEGMVPIMIRLGLSFEGKQHSALADALNALRLLKFLDRGRQKQGHTIFTFKDTLENR